MSEIEDIAVSKERAILEQIKTLLARPANGFQNLIGLLQEIQDSFGYVPKSSLPYIAARLGISSANVYGVATFYNQFRFTPPGKCHIKVCLGTACHIKGGELIMDHWKRQLDIPEGGRTPDGEYSLERVACIGCCTLAPVSVVCNKIEPRMSPTRVDGILLTRKIEKEQAEKEVYELPAAQAKSEGLDQ